MTEPSTAAQRIALVQATWPAEPQIIPGLRAEVRDRLSLLGYTGETVEDIVLAVNEAASNVVDHAYAAAGADNTFDVLLWIEGGALHIEIVDRGQWRPRQLAPSGRGFGIVIMKELVDTLVIDHGPSGTSVLLRHRLPADNPQRPTVTGSDRSSSDQATPVTRNGAGRGTVTRLSPEQAGAQQ